MRFRFFSTQRQGMHPSRLTLVVMILSMVSASCAKKTEEIITECVVNPDQANLFKGHWSSRPIPLAVEVGDFSSAEIAAIESAINAWNDFFEASKGFKLYLNGSSSLGYVSAGGARITTSTACSQQLANNSGFVGKIMIYKNRSWANSQSSIMALTSLCPQVVSGAQFRVFTSAVMELNYDDYFISGKPLPDLQSIVTHELGHILGLDHSCSGSGCSNAPNDYRDAIMYPSLGFSGIYGQVKRSIERNDQERANCLY